MSQVSQQPLDAQFTWDDEAGVQLGLRLLTKVVEARLAGLEGQRADFDAAITGLTEVALKRINEVLLPTLPLLDEIIRLGFGSDKILDAGAFGRFVLQTKTPADFYAVTEAAHRDAVTSLESTVASMLARLNAITGGADAALDTFVEVSLRLAQDNNALGALMDAVSKRLRFDAAQVLTSAQRLQALMNLGASDVGRGVLAAADPATARTVLGAQQALGFTPIESGGGADMSAFPHKVRIGWGTDSRLRGQIDDLGIGQFWMEYGCPGLQSKNGYQKFQNGTIIQWGEIDTTADQSIPFPTAFPTLVAVVLPIVYYGTSGSEFWGVNIDGDTRFGFTAHIRHITGGSVVTEPGTRVFKYIAVGY